MARTIDSIVASHRAARELRAAGRPVWTRTVDIRTILRESDELTPERIADAAVRIAAALRSGLPAAMFDITTDGYERDLDEAVEDLEAYTAQSLRTEAGDGTDIVAEFNGRLDEIYDWADRTRVWLG